MKRYRVKALSVGGKRNKVHHLNEEVTEAHFPEGIAKELVEKDFLEEIGEDDEVPRFEPQPPVITHKEPKQPEVTIDQVTRKDLMKLLKKMGVDFQANATKQELFDIWSKK